MDFIHIDYMESANNLLEALIVIVHSSSATTLLFKIYNYVEVPS
jgi:hypothetical protein